MPQTPRHFDHAAPTPGGGSSDGDSDGNHPTDVDPTESDFLASFGQSGRSTEWYSPEPAGYVRGRTKYVAVIGTVMSGLGKGIFSSSLAKLLQDKGLRVAPSRWRGTSTSTAAR